MTSNSKYISLTKCTGKDFEWWGQFSACHLVLAIRNNNSGNYKYDVQSWRRHCILNIIIMRKFVSLLSVLVAALVLAEAARIRRDEKYTTKYDNINLDEILESDRLLDNYIKCLLEKGKCTPEGVELKSHVSDALQNDCAKCSDKQKSGAEKVIKFLYKNKPEQWKLLQEKYDPDNVYFKKYENKLKDTTS